MLRRQHWSLEALRAEADGLTIHTEQIDVMNARIDKAQGWATRAKAALQGKAGLEQVRALLDESSSLDESSPPPVVASFAGGFSATRLISSQRPPSSLDLRGTRTVTRRLLDGMTVRERGRRLWTPTARPPRRPLR